MASIQTINIYWMRRTQTCFINEKKKNWNILEGVLHLAQMQQDIRKLPMYRIVWSMVVVVWWSGSALLNQDLDSSEYLSKAWIHVQMQLGNGSTTVIQSTPEGR